MADEREGWLLARSSRPKLDKLLAELQSGAMTSGVVSIDVGHLPAAYVRFDSWPKAPAPVHGMITDPETGQSWRIRLNQVTKRWEVIQSSEAAMTEAEHAVAMAEIRRLWDSPVGTPEGDQLDRLIALVEAYEDEQEALEATNDQRGADTGR